MKIAVLLVGVHLVAAQYGLPPSKKGTSSQPDSVNEIVPPDDPRDHGLNGLAPGVNPQTDYWWTGPNSPFRPGATGGSHQGAVHPHPGQGPASGCPPSGCGAPPPCTGAGCPPPAPAGSNPFAGQGYGPRPGSSPSAGSSPAVGPAAQPSTPDANKPIDVGSNPFLSNALQKPVPSSPNACSSQDTYCVPPQHCYNGLITGPSSGYKVCFII